MSQRGNQTIKTAIGSQSRFDNKMHEIVQSKEASMRILLPLPCLRTVRANAAQCAAAIPPFGQMNKQSISARKS